MTMAWEFAELIDPLDPRWLKCKLCGKVMSGGVTRMKQHIGQIKGAMTSCMQATQDQITRAEKIKHEEEIKALVTIEANEYDQEHLNEVGDGDPKKGPVDVYIAPIDPSIPLRSRKQQTINDSVDKERSYRVGQYLARWMYKKNVAFNAIKDDDFKQFCEALGRYGPDWKQPSKYLIREKMLVKEVERTRDLLNPHEVEGADTGCFVMTDAWADKKRRSIMNLCVHCKLGTVYLGSKEASTDAHTSLYIFSYVEVISGLMEAIEQFYLDDEEKQNKVLNIDLPKFKKKEGEWWATYGLQTPTLMHFALRILNLTTSSSGCERNWSVFEQVDAKRRNKLDVRRRDDLVYIQFNGRMIDKRKKYSSSCDGLLGEDASMAQDWICEGAYVLAEEVDGGEEVDAMAAFDFVELRRSARVRELHEVEHFVSDGEESDHGLVNEDEIDSSPMMMG